MATNSDGTVSQPSGTPSDLIAWFNSTIQSCDATFLNYLNEFNELVEQFRAKNVSLFAVCAENQEEVERAMRDWNLKFKCLSDPTHILRNYLAKEDLVTIAVSGGENATDSRFYKMHPKIKYYKNGVAQPAVLCIKPDRKVLYRWAVVPQLANVGGASDRPVPADIWGLVQTRLSDPEYKGEATTAAQLNTRGALSACIIA